MQFYSFGANARPRPARNFASVQSFENDENLGSKLGRDTNSIVARIEIKPITP
jgi:hypothetical protein